MGVNFLLVVFCSFFPYLTYSLSDNSNPSDTLLTATNTGIMQGSSMQINENEFGTFLLHLPASIKSTYTPYLSQEEMKTKMRQTNSSVISSMSSSRTVNLTTTLSSSQSQNTATHLHNTVSSSVNRFRQSPSQETTTTSTFKTQSSVGQGFHGVTPTLYPISLSVFYLLLL